MTILTKYIFVVFFFFVIDVKKIIRNILLNYQGFQQRKKKIFSTYIKRKLKKLITSSAVPIPVL